MDRSSVTAVRMIHMCSVLYSLCLIASSALVTETTKGIPPFRSDNVQRKHFVQEGTKNWKIYCAVEGEINFLVWKKDGEQITVAWPRYKVTPETKELKIRNVSTEDAGEYMCEATNGFGAATVEYTVVVLGKNEQIRSTFNDNNDNNFDTPDLIEAPSTNSDGIPRNRAPFWTHGDPSTTFSHPVGGTATLRCRAAGRPIPETKWLKDGKEMEDYVSNQGTIILKELSSKDAGVYTCRIYNVLGYVNATFTLKVTPYAHAPTLPEFDKHHPINTTANEGQSATFHCHVRSNEQPIIKWVKILEDDADAEINQTVLVRGRRILVLDKKYPFKVDFQNATWLTRLTIPSVTVKDAGWYVCYVTSHTGGDILRFAYLQVLPVVEQLPVSDSLPLQFLIGIPLGLVLLLLVGYAISYLFFLQKHQQKPSSSTTAFAGAAGRPPPPPSYPPPSLPASSSHKASPYRNANATPPVQSSASSGGANGQHAFLYNANSTPERSSQMMIQQHQQQPLLYSKDNVYNPAPSSLTIYKSDYKAYHHLDPQAAVPLNSPLPPSEVYETTTTPQPYELQYDDSDFSDSCYDGAGARIQHYPSMYSCR